MTLPVLHFEQIQIDEETSDDRALNVLSELVSPGQLLVSLSESKSDEAVEVVLDPGEHTERTADKTGITALCHGYPVLTLQDSGFRQVVHISLIPLLEISQDRMEAKINLFPPLPDQTAISMEKLEEILQQARILFGVNRDLLKHSLEQIEQTGQPIRTLVFARGQAPIDGKDAYIRPEIEIDPIAGKELGDGSIDFKERRMFIEIKEGQLIATKVPRTEGTPGRNLTGDELPAREGKDILVKISDDAAFNEEDGTIRANASGVLSLVNQDTIKVSAKQAIDGDVDYNTGNIRSRNAVEISGSVQPGFTVAARGDLMIRGDVRQTTIQTQGNLVVQGGVLGEETEIRARGDADIHHIEQGKLTVGGNLLLRSSAYYSTIHVSGDLRGENKVKLVGGTVIVGGSLTVGQLGSQAGSPIFVAVGTDTKRHHRYKEMQETYRELLEKLQNWQRRHGEKKKKGAFITNVEMEIRQIEQQLHTLNLITGTPEDSLGDPEHFFTPAKIVVYGTMAAQSHLRIGNESMVLDKNYNSCKAHLDKYSGEIVLAPL